MIFADCGDHMYEWLPQHEVAGSDDEDGLVARLRFPELGNLLCCGFSVAMLAMAGCKKRHSQRIRAERALWCKMARSLKKFQALWALTEDPACEKAQTRRLQLRRGKKPMREEVALVKDEAIVIDESA